MEIADVTKQPTIACLPSNERLAYREFGNLEGPTVCFIHGWPDSDEVFDKQYQALQDKYRIVTFSLPWFDAVASAAHREPSQPHLGIPFLEVCGRFYNGVAHAMQDRPNEHPMLICHDWGSFISWTVVHEHPNLFSRIVCLDVAEQRFDQLNPIELALTIFYQLTLALVTLLPKFISTPLTWIAALFAWAPQPLNAHGGMNFMYFRWWQLMLTTGRPKSLTEFTPPPCPTLLMYGTRFWIHFHSRALKEHLRGTEGSDVMAFKGWHWFFREPQCVDEVNAAIATFLSRDP